MRQVSRCVRGAGTWQLGCRSWDAHQGRRPDRCRGRTAARSRRHRDGTGPARQWSCSRSIWCAGFGAHVIIGDRPGLPGARSPVDQWFGGRYETTTDPLGAYVFDGVDPGREFIAPTTHLGDASEQRGIGDPRVAARRCDGRFELLGSGRIEGVVEGLRAARPVVFARRADEPEGARRQSVETSGEFRFDDAPPGDYVVSLRVPKSSRPRRFT